MGPLALVMTTGDAGGYLCPVDETGLAHLFHGPVTHVPLTESLVALVHTQSDRHVVNDLATRFAQALRLTQVPELRGTVVVFSMNTYGDPRDLPSGVVSLARRTLAPQDHVLPQHPQPLPRTYAVVDPEDHENVLELLRVGVDGEAEVREAHGWFPHSYGLPRGPLAPPVVEVSDLRGLASLVEQIDESTTVRRRVRDASTQEDPWGQFVLRLQNHLLDPAHLAADGSIRLLLHHLDPEFGSPLTKGRPFLRIHVTESALVRLDLPANARLSPEWHLDDLTARRLARSGWVADAEDLHSLQGDSVLLPRLVEQGVAALRSFFRVGSPDHLLVTLVSGGRTIRASDRLALLGAPRPLVLTAQPPARS